jgi:uncharacterized membrane protein YfcA
MELTIALGFFGALLMGFVLGVLGGGGAILTIPILVYLFGFDCEFPLSFHRFFLFPFPSVYPILKKP